MRPEAARSAGPEAAAAPAPLILRVDARDFEFVPVSLAFEPDVAENVFAGKDEATLEATVGTRKYAFLAAEARSGYAPWLDRPLGSALLELKEGGDPFYRKFLNRAGDLAYCEFRVADRGLRRLAGLFAFTVGEELKYVGRAPDGLGRKIDRGCGRIEPKKCYLDGQAHSCRLNALVALYRAEARLFLHPMREGAAIKAAEAALVLAYRPDWNLLVRGKDRREAGGGRGSHTSNTR